MALDGNHTAGTGDHPGDHNLIDRALGMSAATGDGTTDDRAAIQAALTAAAAAGGGTVYLPPGTYIINKYLLIGSKVHLRGAGVGLTTIKCGATFTGGGTAPMGGGYSMIQPVANGQTDVAISDLTFDGNESANRATLAASGNRVSSYLVDMRQVTGLRLHGIATRNSWTYNIMIHTCSRFIVQGCSVQSPNTSGVYNQLDGIHVLGSNRGRVVDNDVDNGIGTDADDALVAHVVTGGQPCFDITYANNVARGGANGNGIQLAGDQAIIRDITISGNVFWGCRRGIFTNFYAASGNQPIRSVTITGNTVRDCTTLDGIVIHTAADGVWEDITISNNVVDGYGNASAQFNFGIAVENGGASRGITITGNVLRNGYSRGIYLSEGAPLVRDYVIANNVVDMSAAQGAPLAVILGQSRDGVLSGNIITGRAAADGTGVYMTSTATNQATNQTLIGNRIRNFGNGIQVTNGAGNNPTNTLVVGNNTQGCGTGVSVGSATVTQANNL